MTAALLAFREDRQPSTVMGRITKGFSPAELNAIAVFWSAVR